jgi:TP901 family phage tail tape measure protein
MAESKYSLKLAAIDAYSSTFGDMGKKSAKLQDQLREQQAELRRLNSQAKDVEGYARLGASLEQNRKQLGTARAEQQRLSREHAAAQNRVMELGTAYGRATVATKALETSTTATKGQIKAAALEQQRLERELNAATLAEKKLANQHDKAAASAGGLERAVRREHGELDRLGGSLTRAGVDLTKLAAEQLRLKNATNSATAALDAQRAKLDAVKRSSGKIEENRNKRAELRGQMVETAAIGYLASRPVDKAMQLETAMADVGKVLTFSKDDGEQKAGIKSMASDNLKLASDRRIASAGMTAVDLAKIEYAAGQSGIGKDAKTPEARRTQIMDFTKDAAIMGAAFDIDAKTAGETMAGWQASMKLDRGGTLDLADATNYLGNSFNAQAADIAAVVKRFGAVGSASGMKPEQSAALSAALLNPGTEKEIAGTGFKNFLSALTAGKSATKGEKAQWKDLGFDPEDLATDMQKNAPATIMSVLQAIKAAPKEEQAAIATTLFGSESIGAIQPLIENLEPLQQAFAMVADKSKYATSALGDQASMMQEAEGVAKTSRTSWNAFTSRIDRMTTLVGNAMLPALNAVLVPMGAVVDGISWAAEKFPNITGALAVAAGGLAALKVGALGVKFVGLLLGQAFNKAGLARAKLDGTTARTASVADLAVSRLNASMGRLGTTGAAGGAGDGVGDAGGKKRGKGKASSLKSRGARIARGAGRVAAPLALAVGGIEVINGLQNGDSEEVGRGVGNAAGGMGGAWAGGAAGAAIGTLILPGVGTAIGAAVGSLAGGFAGSELGSWVGEKAGGLYDWATGKDDESPSKAEALAPAAATIVAPGAPGAPGVPGMAVALAPATAALSPATPPLAPSAAVLGTPSASQAMAPGVVPLMATAAQPAFPGAAPATGLPLPAVPAAAALAPSAVASEALEPSGVGDMLGRAMTAVDSGLGAAGSWLGDVLDKLGNLLQAPDAVAKDVAQASDNRQTTFAPTLQINGADQATSQALADKIVAQLQAQFMPMFTAPSLAIARGASLTDGSS